MSDYTVNPDSGCWEWSGAITRGGYGKTKDQRYAHRVQWERINGPVPAGLEIDHLCANKRCCNPAHLEAVTHAENSRRSPKSKINSEIAATIRRMHAGGIPPRHLAPMFGLAISTIGNIVGGHRWADHPELADSFERRGGGTRS